MPIRIFSTAKSNSSGEKVLHHQFDTQLAQEEQAELLASVKRFYDHIDTLAINLENDDLHIRFDTTAGTDFYEAVQRELEQQGLKIINDLPEEQMIICSEHVGRFLKHYGHHLMSYAQVPELLAHYEWLDSLRMQAKHIKEVRFSDDKKYLIIHFNVSELDFYHRFIDALKKINFTVKYVEGENELKIPTRHDWVHLLNKLGNVKLFR